MVYDRNLLSTRPVYQCIYTNRRIYVALFESKAVVQRSLSTLRLCFCGHLPPTTRDT